MAASTSLVVLAGLPCGTPRFWGVLRCSAFFEWGSLAPLVIPVRLLVRLVMLLSRGFLLSSLPSDPLYFSG